MSASDVATAPLPWFDRAWHAVLDAALFSLGLFLLFSTAGVAIALVVLVALFVLAPQRVWRLQPWREPVIAIGLLLFGYIVLRTVFGDVSRTAASAINHYHELLMVPIVWCLLRLSRRPQVFINGLILGCLVLAVAHWGAPLNEKLAWFLHTRRVSAGFGLAICAFLFFEHARLGRIPRRLGFAVSAFVATTLVFAYTGRTGHLLLLMLTVCAAWRAAPRKWRLPVALGTLVLAIAVAGLSSSVRNRMVQSWAEMQQAGTTGQPLPRDSRVELLRTGLEVVERGPLLGVGWARYPDTFQEISARRLGKNAPPIASENPHNEYLLLLGAGGIPALLLFLAWLAWPLWRVLRARQRPSPWLGALACVTVAFAIAAIFNSALHDFVEAHMYGALMAWLLVRRVES